MKANHRFFCVFLTILICVPMLLMGCADNTSSDSREETNDVTQPLGDVLILIGNGAQPYSIVRSDHADDQEMDAVKLIRTHFQKNCISPTVTTDWKGDPVSDFEIVVGNTTRDAMDNGIDLESYELTAGEFLIKVSGTRIYLIGGTPSDTLKAAEYFLQEFFGYKGDPNNISACSSVTIPQNYEYLREQNSVVRILTIAGNPINQYTISYGAETASSEVKGAAQNLQTFFSNEMGYRPQIVEKSPANTPTIVLSIDGSQNNGTFTAEVKNGNLIIVCDIADGFEIGINRFIREKLTVAKTIQLEETFYYEINLMEYVTYLDFGAKGDGVTDDLAAIIATHEYANKHQIPVKADDGKTFYIGVCERGAIIKTDTDFTGASFIIDDREVPMNLRKVAIFTVAPDKAPYELSALKTLRIGQTNIGMTLPEDSVITVTEAGTKRYIRKGYNADNDGVDQNEVLVVDQNGNISEHSPVIWDYTNITSAEVTPIDQELLVIKGGTFTTIADDVVETTGYYKRGFLIQRSNVTVEEMQHDIKNEGIDGAPYQSFMDVLDCYNVTLKDCIFTPHKTYYWMKNGIRTSVGTYDISPVRVVNFTMKNCKQSIDILDQKYWGIICTNFCKNILLDGCELSKIDAHQGVHNVKVLHSELGWLGIDITGSGELYVENCTLHGTTMIKLRDDYGSTWHGNVTVKNSTWAPNRGKWLSDEYYCIIGGTNLQQHDFGYECYLPTTITIENLHIDDSKATTAYQGIMLFADLNPNRIDIAAENAMPQQYHITKTVNISGVTLASGKVWGLSTNQFMFRNVTINSN